VDQRQAMELKRKNLTVEAGRRRLAAISRKYWDEVLQYCADNKQVLMVASVGTWSKESTEMEKECEILNATLWKIFEEKNSDPKKVPPTMKGTLKNDGGAKMPYRLTRWDPTKDKMLQERYKVNSVPIFLFFYQKRLVGLTRRWNGYGQTKRDLIKELEKQYENGQRGRFLPEDYSPAVKGLPPGSTYTVRKEIRKDSKTPSTWEESELNY